MYCFRLPFTLSKRCKLGIADDRVDLLDDGGRHVWLASSNPGGGPLSEATELVVRGEGYDSHEQAGEDGERWRDVVSRAFARVGLAADFADRKAYGMFFKVGERLLSERAGHPVLGVRPGVTTFEYHPKIAFYSVTGEVSKVPSEEVTRWALHHAAELDERLTGAERLAFDLFSGSFFQPSSDARLLLLTMAVESLLDLAPRSAAARAHVDALLAATESNPDLSDDERKSLSGSLKWLWNESINQAGKRLARTLEPRTYDDLSPAKFFGRCYEVRSRLVHGRGPLPDRREVDLLAAHLEIMVGNLLSGSLLDQIID